MQQELWSMELRDLLFTASHTHDSYTASKRCEIVKILLGKGARIDFTGDDITLLSGGGIIREITWLLVDYHPDTLTEALAKERRLSRSIVNMIGIRATYKRRAIVLLCIGSKNPVVCKDVIGLVAKHLFSMRQKGV